MKHSYFVRGYVAISCACWYSSYSVTSDIWLRRLLQCSGAVGNAARIRRLGGLRHPLLSDISLLHFAFSVALFRCLFLYVVLFSFSALNGISTGTEVTLSLGGDVSTVYDWAWLMAYSILEAGVLYQ